MKLKTERRLKALGWFVLGAFAMYCFLWGKIFVWDLPNAWQKMNTPSVEVSQ